MQHAKSAELLLLAMIVLCGVALRVWQPAHLSVEHFDEGVYASNLLCPFNGNAYPFRDLYAPPLLPALLEWALILSGVSAASVMWVNVIAGCAMVPSVWWVSRTWFGPLAGLTAAAFAALSPIHIQYSRAALTDGLLCLWMLWGVYWAWRAILGGEPLAILLAGLFASLAWWTKYNGWLTLAISGAGLAAWLIAPAIVPERLAAHFRSAMRQHRNRGDTASRDGSQARLHVHQAVIRWGLVAIIAGVGWAPVLVGLQDVGGYEAVAANHARYFVGPAGWMQSFARQAANLSHYHGGLTLLAMTIAVGAMVVLKPLLPSQPARAVKRSLASWMLSAWFVGLFVAVPLYTPYPRLTLPWVLATWIVAGTSVSWVLDRFPFEGALKSRAALCGGLSALMLITGFVLQRMANRANRVTADRRGLQVIAGQILDQVGADSRASEQSSRAVAIRVIGEPGLFYHLAVAATHRTGFSEGLVIVPAADYAAQLPDTANSVRIYTVVGPHAPPLDRIPPEVREHLTLVKEWDYRPSDLVLLDEMGPAALSDRRSLPTKPVLLYRLDR